MSASISIAMTDSTRIGEARRVATSVCRELGFDEEAAGRAAVIVTELAHNLARHAQNGQLLLSFPGEIPGGEAPASIGIMAIDKGPGISDLRACFADGFSTAGTCGTGLGAVRRLSDGFDCYTRPGGGTVMAARIDRDKCETHAAFDFGGVSLPLAGESLSGDAWAVRSRRGALDVFVVDGIGHGPAAHDAAREAVTTFYEDDGRNMLTTMSRINNALVKTRGAAASLATIDAGIGELRFCGVGNVTGIILAEDGTTRGMVTHNGTLGSAICPLQQFSYRWQNSDQLVMYTDGLKSLLDFSRYPGLLRKDPNILAGVLYRDFARGRDDATVVVAREASPPSYA